MRKSVIAGLVAGLLAVSWGSVAAVTGATDPVEIGRRAKAFAVGVADEPRYYQFDASVMGTGASGRRVYLFHGLRLNSSFWDKEPYPALKAALLSRGDELVLVNLPYARPAMMRDGGGAYCKRFRDWFDAFDAKQPKRAETVAIGVSWGGWHTMLIGDKLDRAVVFKPVTEPSNLREFWWEGASACRRNLPQRNLAIYSPADPRVGDATNALKSAGARIQISELPTHRVTDADVSAALRWLEKP